MSSRVRLLVASAVASGAATYVCAVLVLRRRRRRSSTCEVGRILASGLDVGRVLVAACDLDKTVYPPAGGGQAKQLRANVRAMAAFESLGGFVFPVTGNNVTMAQVKFADQEGARLRVLGSNPGIFCNGGLVLGPGGAELEKHVLGQLQIVGTSLGSANEFRVDFVTALIDFLDGEEQRVLLDGVGLLFFMPDLVAGYREAYANVDAFCAIQRVTPLKMSRDELVSQRERILQAVFLFPPLGAADYETSCRPWQLKVQAAMKAHGLMDCRVVNGAHSGVGEGIKLTLMKDPWPEMDICVGGVDKGKALARFLQHTAVVNCLGVDHIDPAAHVAVFGDAANDVPMFREIGGTQPGLRVGMPHATHGELVELSNVRAEVSEVLEQLCEARAVARSWTALRASGLSHVEIAALRIRACLRLEL